jgi:hypothetical protein
MTTRIDIAPFAVWRATAGSPKPDVSFVPPLERRRLTGVERAAISVAWQVKIDAELPVVFASRWGEIGVTIKLMQQFHEEGEMSPAGFSASVHNAAPGAFSLLTKNHAPYTAIAARDRSLEAGLLETLALRREAIFVYAEEATPEFYLPEFGEPQPACALAMRVTESADAPFSLEFRHADLPPATFDGLVAFLEARESAFPTSNLCLSR